MNESLVECNSLALPIHVVARFISLLRQVLLEK